MKSVLLRSTSSVPRSTITAKTSPDCDACAIDNAETGIDLFMSTSPSGFSRSARISRASCPDRTLWQPCWLAILSFGCEGKETDYGSGQHQKRWIDFVLNEHQKHANRDRTR